MNDLGDPIERIKSLQEWAIKQASKYDRKYAKYNDARAWVMAQRYYLVVELCDKTAWHYPSKGDYPTEGENLLVLVSDNFDDYRIGHLGTDKLWWTNDGVEDDIVCWQYIVPPKENA